MKRYPKCLIDGWGNIDFPEKFVIKFHKNLAFDRFLIGNYNIQYTDLLFEELGCDPNIWHTPGSFYETDDYASMMREALLTEFNCANLSEKYVYKLLELIEKDGSKPSYIADSMVNKLTPTILKRFKNILPIS